MNGSSAIIKLGYLETHASLQFIFAVVLSVTAAVGIFGNILVILTVVMTKALRISSNMFIVNLAVADLVVTTIVDPFNVIGAFVGSSYFVENHALCQMIASFCAPACLCSMFSICAISVNRYVMICHYHRYEGIFTWRKTGMMCVCLWLLSYMLHLPNHVGWGHNDFDGAFYICTFSIATHSYAIFYITLGVFVPLVIVLFSYASVFRRYWRVKNDIRKRRNTAVFQMRNNSIASPTEDESCRLQVPVLSKPLQRSASENTMSHSGGSSSSNLTGMLAPAKSMVNAPSYAQLSTCKKSFTNDDIKLAKTLFTVFIAFLVCWSPFSLLVLLKQPAYIPGWIYMIAIVMAHGNSSINSILYGLTNERFREGYMGVLGMEIKSRMNAVKHSLDNGSLRVGGGRFPIRKTCCTSANTPSQSEWLKCTTTKTRKKKSAGIGRRLQSCEMLAITVVGTATGGMSARTLAPVESSVSEQLLSPNGIIIVLPDSSSL